VYKTKAVEII